MGSMWNVPTCSIELAQFFIPVARRDAGIVRHPRCRRRGGSSSAPRRRFSSGEFAPIDGSSFIHVTCVTRPVAGEITIRQPQVRPLGGTDLNHPVVRFNTERMRGSHYLGDYILNRSNVSDIYVDWLGEQSSVNEFNSEA